MADVTNTKTAAETKAQTRVAAAWTIANSMLPMAPIEVRKKFAHNLLGNSTQALKSALRQTAVNAHWTRVAETLSQVHKVDLNDLLENPSVLSSEKKGVEQELKGDPKSAAAKVADDRKDAGPLPAEYPEPKRDEPSELDGSHAAEGRPEFWTEGPGSKEAAKKTACSEGCTGECDHMKEASAKKAEDEGAAAEAPAEEKPAEEPKAEDAPADEPKDEIPADDAAADEPAAEEPAKEEETFDPEKQNLQEIAHDLEADNDRLQEAIAELAGEEPGDITFAEGEGEGDDFFGDMGGHDDLSIAEQPLPDGGEELSLDDIFDQGNMADKVSALNDEDHIDIELGGDDYFAPSDPAELESVLDEEEGLSTPEMFAVEVENDPLARIFASKQAGEEGIVEPGTLDSHFETELAGDTRDAETDHDESIFEEVLKSIKQPTRDDHRDTQPNLKEPSNKEATKKQAGIRTIKQVPVKKAAEKVNLASLLFTDESDYL